MFVFFSSFLHLALATGSIDGVSVCLIVCHGNRISADGWRDSGGEIESKTSTHRKKWIVMVTGFPFSHVGE